MIKNISFLIILMFLFNGCDNKTIEYYDNGNVKYEVGRKNDKRHGLYKEYYRNGKIKETIEYNMGELEGEYINYNIDGEISSIFTYKNSKKHGPSKFYGRNSFEDSEGNILWDDEYFLNPNGNLLRESNWNNDLKDGPYVEYFYDGNVKEKSNYKNGYKYGLSVIFYENGQVKEKINYKEPICPKVEGNLGDEEHGEYISYFKNGQIKTEGNYKEGEYYGLWKFYNEDGSIKRTYEHNWKKENRCCGDIVNEFCYPDCDNVLSTYKLSDDCTFIYSTNTFGGMSRWGYFEEVGDNTFRLITTNVSPLTDLPKAQTIKLISGKKFKVGNTIYKRD